MKNALVVYASRYGHTRRYAQWIAGQLGCPALEARQLRPQQLAACEVLVYGGGLYAGGLNGAKKVLTAPHPLEGKELVVFTCGLADPADEATRQHIRAELTKALPEALGRAHLFFLRGGMDYSRLGPVHRLMMAMMRRMLLKKPEAERGGQDRGILETYGKTVDFVDMETARPLVELVREL
ncbi:flavodoxin domain-containing protein [Allofournierella sp.]|uniref:flavodoxin domain-containing protein n=1 Tax=Allofournierella sp. TaxID=1940256 RepID=UPI003AB739B5